MFCNLFCNSSFRRVRAGGSGRDGGVVSEGVCRCTCSCSCSIGGCCDKDLTFLKVCGRLGSCGGPISKERKTFKRRFSKGGTPSLDVSLAYGHSRKSGEVKPLEKDGLSRG